MSDRNDTAISRRGLLAALAGGSVLAGLGATQAPTDDDSLGVGGAPGILQIGPSETYHVPSGETETYRAINIAQGGRLDLDGTTELIQ